MTTYTVQWTIDIDADTAREAAEQAWSIMKEPSNEASIMDVYIAGDKVADFNLNELEYGGNTDYPAILKQQNS